MTARRYPLRASRDTPREFRAAGGAAQIAAAAGAGELPGFSGNAYTGAAMRPEGWRDPVVIDLAGIKVPRQHRPVLRQHDHEQLVGHTTAIKVDAAGLQVAGVFSGQPEHVDKVVTPAKNGFQWQLSVGANPIRVEYLKAGEDAEVNGRTVSGPLTISRETELGEISFVPLGADGDTSAAVHASKRGPAMNPFQLALKKCLADLRAAGKVAAAKYSDDDVEKMSEADAKAALKECMAAADDEPDEDDEEEETEATAKAAKQAAKLQASADQVMKDLRQKAAAEHVRQAAITAAVKKHGVAEIELDGKRVNLAAHAVEHGWSAEKAELHALRAARPGPGVGVPGGLGYSPSTPEVNEAVLEAAVLHSLRHQFRLEDDSFYLDRAPDGTSVRRVSERLQREAQGGLKARYTDQVQQAAHTAFKGRIGLHRLLAAAFGANGQRFDFDMKSEGGVRSMLAAWDHMEGPGGIRAEGASNLSISNILANVLNKFALQGYLYVEQAWREVAAIRPVNDFKPSKSINLLGDVMYKQVGSSGELQNASLGDQAFANQAAMYGRILTLPYTHLVNDDLGMLGGAPMKIGQGAGLALNDAFWTVWKNMAAGTVNGDDGNAFWRTTSSVTAAAMKAGTAYMPNKIAGGSSALDSAALKAAKAMFDRQIDPNGNPLGFDGSMPTLLFPPTLWQTVIELLTFREIVYGGASAARQPNGNVWAGTMKPVMSRYLENASYGNSATGWFVLFNPAALATIEVAFLNGTDTPAVLQAGPDYQFDRLGISIRGTMPFGVTQQNFRGGVYNVGA